MTRKHFTEQEKLEMVLSVLRNESSKTDICREKGLSPRSFEGWKRQFLQTDRQYFNTKELPKPASNPGDLERENQRLRRELASREHDIVLLKQLLLYR